MAVLDEADEMLNMGFREDIETILEADRQARAESAEVVWNMTRQSGSAGWNQQTFTITSHYRRPDVNDPVTSMDL